MARNTTTGHVLESMVLPSLVMGGYAYQTQVRIGQRPNGRRHIVDVVASKDNRDLLLSVKWQQVSGTAEQKVPYEVICLKEAVLGIGAEGEFEHAYIVLGGPGWTLREYFASGQMSEHLNYLEQVTIMLLEEFIALANSGGL